MRSFHSLDEIPSDAFPRGTSVAIGKFDGVHRGHQALLARACELAAEHDLESVVFTFFENPQRMLHPELSLNPLMSSQQRLDSFAASGIDTCIMVPFTEDFAEIPAERFAEQVLSKLLRTRRLSVGPDFRFGFEGAGDTAMLTKLGKRFGFELEVIDVIEEGDFGRISSSRVREAITEGDVADAARLLGHPLELRGTVVRGDARGRDLGFPTANLGGEIEGMVPAEGIYAGWAVVRGERHPAAISVGNNPTFTPDAEPRVEAFLLDFDGELYGEPIRVQFAERLRGNIVFDGMEALMERMAEDVRETRAILSERDASRSV
ncbi:MAG: bifunctional riboflavin kinase/FAD synthetase [Candidatus Leucobacter sulfamidivorax]|nr:bifunctional riboflavin kinase/FAD synthetase [Candidatus Leucobacter sulfamidivorax]